MGSLKKKYMKKVIVVLVLCITGLVACAQDTLIVQPPILPPDYGQELGRQKIQVTDLPEAVQETLKGSDYSAWTVDAAYKAHITDPQSPESEGLLIYIVELVKGNDKLIRKFDEEGKEIEIDEKRKK